MKDIVFVGQSLNNLKEFSLDARREAGYQLDKVQHGENPFDWKPMQTVGSGVREIRITDSDGAFRVIYVAKFEKVVYVLHAFQKKTQKTRKADLDIAKRAYKKVIEEHDDG